ncbi:unknown [Firmicutes bacterium CAG:822]|nr:unknown [Firmicutes bacterium CAG:822]
MNNKGFTVVELIASFALTMVITVFLFEVLIEVKDIFADTSTKTAIQQKASIISKNIENILPSMGSTVSCAGSSCNINGKTLNIEQNNNRVVINGQNFDMPDTVSIKNYSLNNLCDETNCYLYFQMTLDSGNLKDEYTYDITYYYDPTADSELLLTPTFEENSTSSGKTVTIHFPLGCGSSYVCTYKKNNGNTVTAKSVSVKVPFTENGSVVATVNNGSKTISNSYTVNGITSLSAGDVKGGTINLSKNKTINDETVSFTPQADDTFTYKGATVVCENGAQYSIDDSSKSFKIEDNSCTSAVVYPSWQKGEKLIMDLNHSAANPTIKQYLTDVSGTGSYIDSDGSSRYYIQIRNPQGAWSRVQMSTEEKVDITEYSNLYIDTWCTDGNTTMMLGITQETNIWVQNTNGDNFGTNGGTYLSKGGITTNASSTERISCNIEKFTGEWYIGVQRLYTNSYNSHYCNINRIGLTGMTYSYENRGV